MVQNLPNHDTCFWGILNLLGIPNYVCIIQTTTNLAETNIHHIAQP